MLSKSFCGLGFFLLLNLAVWSQTANREEMIRRVFSVFQQKDEAGFVGLFPDAATLRAYMSNLANLDTSASSKAATAAFVSSITDSALQSDFRADFKRFINMGESKGLDWTRIEFTSFQADSIPDKGREKPSASSLEGKIFFRFQNTPWFLSFRDIIWFEGRGWYGVEITRVDQLSQENPALPDEGRPISGQQKKKPAPAKGPKGAKPAVKKPSI